MNIPVGSFLEKGTEAKKINPEKKLSELSAKAFSGYLVLTIEGYSGIEEGMLLFRNGELTGSAFEFVKFNETVFSEDALKLTANAFAASNGIVDIVELSRQQAELVIAFNDKMAFSRQVQPKDLSRLMPSNYDIGLVKSFVGEKLRREESRLDVLRKLGLKEM